MTINPHQPTSIDPPAYPSTQGRTDHLGTRALPEGLGSVRGPM
ncbi:unnamed protein product [Staurois parvus]|uniref:Photosystem II subunit H n=1 Tax=Staurois parvus TaxID=386267 RepID=A0ABN9AP17_9NEOB|nr:unnamed protein product [Staurois parvus]